MCDVIHYGVIEGLVSLERWSFSRGACTMGYAINQNRNETEYNKR